MLFPSISLDLLLVAVAGTSSSLYSSITLSCESTAGILSTLFEVPRDTEDGSKVSILLLFFLLPIPVGNLGLMFVFLVRSSNSCSLILGVGM